ncbi:MAG: DUF6320 domain-containing protein [Lawsonibacter sp.]
MSYCVNCGVELDATAEFCPLCHAPVCNPAQPVDGEDPTPFPTDRREVPPASKRELAILISAMLVSVSVCCALLNLILRAQRIWSLYVIAAAVMVWVWFVPPLLRRGRPLRFQGGINLLAVAIYVLLIAMDLDGWDWYWGLALPILLLLGVMALFLDGLLRKRKRSVLSGLALIVGSVGVFMVGVELLVDRYIRGVWSPGWSLVVLTICLALVIPLIVVRRVPSLREEARRRFHM